MSITSNLGSYFVNVFLIFDELHASVLANWEWTRQWITANIYEAKKYTLYEDVTNSKVPWYVSSSIWLWGVLSLTLGMIFAAYKNKRISEQESDFFYFRKLLEKNNNDSIILNSFDKDDKDEIPLLKLLTYYYDPNIPFTCALRRTFKKNKKVNTYKELDAWLASKSSPGNKKKKEIIREQQLRILNSMLPIFEKIDKDSYFFVDDNLRIRSQVRNRDITQPEISIQSEPSRNIFKRLERLTVLLWEALEFSSLAYWVGFSILCILPIAPTFLALASVGVFWFFNLGLHCGLSACSNKQPQDEQNNQSKISAIKRAYFLDSNQVYDSEEINTLVTKLTNIQRKRRTYLFWGSSNELLRGFLSSFFVTWMIGDVLRASSIAIVSFLSMPIVTIAMTGATLGLGCIASTYFVYQAYQRKKSQLDEIDNHLSQLQNRVTQQNAQENLCQVSVDSFDRTQRRFKEHHNTRWIGIKRSLLNLEQMIAGCFTASFIVRVIVLSSLIQCGVIIGFNWPVLCTVLVCSALFVSTTRIINARSNKTVDRTKRVLDTLDYLDTDHDRNKCESHKTSDAVQPKPEVSGKNNSALENTSQVLSAMFKDSQKGSQSENYDEVSRHFAQSF